MQVYAEGIFLTAMGLLPTKKVSVKLTEAWSCCLFESKKKNYL